MEFRKKQIWSWRSGYDFGDIYCSQLRKLLAKKVRKKEKRRLNKEVNDL